MTTDAATAPAEPVDKVTPVGRRVRLATAAAVFGLLVVGTFVGGDDAFPFGPFRMYATSNQATGEVAVVALEAQTEDGEWALVRPTPSSVGMNVAEFEGQLPRFENDPSLLEAVSSSRSALHPEDEPWVGLRIVRQATVVVDKVPTGEVVETVLAEWNDSESPS